MEGAAGDLPGECERASSSALLDGRVRNMLSRGPTGGFLEEPEIGAHLEGPCLNADLGSTANLR